MKYKFTRVLEDLSPTRAQALEEVLREADGVLGRRANGEIDVLEAERLLGDLVDRYDAPLACFHRLWEKRT